MKGTNKLETEIVDTVMHRNTIEIKNERFVAKDFLTSLSIAAIHTKYIELNVTVKLAIYLGYRTNIINDSNFINIILFILQIILSFYIVTQRTNHLLFSTQIGKAFLRVSPLKDYNSTDSM